MKKALAGAALLLCLGAKVWAGPCAATTYNIYTAGGFTCTMGPLLFSSFTSQYTNAHDLSNAAITDNNVDVTLVQTGSTYGFTFSLASGMAVRDNGTGAQQGRAVFTFTVAGAPMNLAAIALAGTRDGTGTDATYTATFSGTSLDTSAANQKLTDSGALAMLTTVNVSGTATANIPGGNLQQAQVQSVTNTVTVAPEPGTAALLALAFCGGAFTLRRGLAGR